ncbi:MAG: twin transmembrane helix small protein [Usitatibacteraceae bacterium]
MKILVVILLLLVITSLFSALFFMYRDKGDSKRMVTALTFRIVLSVAIFVILIGSYYFGLIPPR